MYALAKTWSAPEMPRPGCVWTHTIYIEFADLSTIMAPSRLTRVFNRPDSTGWSSYGLSTSMNVSDFNEPEIGLSLPEEQWLASVLNALYKYPRERVATKRDPSVSVDALTLQIWNQQWPRLRRSFRFCTLTTKDRSTSGAPFDLQVLPNDEMVGRMRHAGVLAAMPLSDVHHPDWLLTLLNDMREPNHGGLRGTLRKLGADTLGGREAMSTLSLFHRITSSLSSSEDLHLAIAMLDKQGLLARSEAARALLVEHILQMLEAMDDLAVKFLWENWQFIDIERLRSGNIQLALRLWRKFPERLLADLCGDIVEKANWAAAVISSLDAEDLVEEWPDIDVPLRLVLAIRLELLDMPAFWKRITVQSPKDLHGIELSDKSIGALINGMERSSAMSIAVQWLGPLRVLSVLQDRSQRTDWSPNELRWISHCVSDVSIVAEYLSRTQTPSVHILQALASELDPDIVPNQFGDDPWFTILRKLKEIHGSIPLGLVP